MMVVLKSINYIDNSWENNDNQLIIYLLFVIENIVKKFLEKFNIYIKFMNFRKLENKYT